MTMGSGAPRAGTGGRARGAGGRGPPPCSPSGAGGPPPPADAALTMQLGAEGNFVGSGIFKSEDPARTAKAIVEATTHFTDADLIAKGSRGLGEPMRGLSLETIPAVERLAARGWGPPPAAPGCRGTSPRL